jgi:hypothetical protein
MDEQERTFHRIAIDIIDQVMDNAEGIHRFEIATRVWRAGGYQLPTVLAAFDYLSREGIIETVYQGPSSAIVADELAGVKRQALKDELAREDVQDAHLVCRVNYALDGSDGTDAIRFLGDDWL